MTHADVQACCATLSGKCPDSNVPCEACTDADISAYTTTTVAPATTTGAPVDNSLFYLSYAEDASGKCVQNCVGDPPCGGLSTETWVTKHTDVQECCEKTLSWKCPNSDVPCEACTDADLSAYTTTTAATTTTTQAATTTGAPTTTTTGAPVDNSLFYLSYAEDASGKCVQNCVGDPPCGGLSTETWVTKHTDVQECCEKTLSWKCPNSDVPCEACTDADLSAYTTTTAATTTTTQAATTTGAPTTTTTGAPVDNTLFYVSYAEDATGKCVQNCVGDDPCGGENTESWLAKHSDAKECCDKGLSWKSLEQCTDADMSAYITTTTQPPALGIFYIDWSVGKCVEDCTTAGEAHCRGPPTYQQHHPDVASCCMQHLSYTCDGVFPCSECTDVPIAP